MLPKHALTLGPCKINFINLPKQPLREEQVAEIWEWATLAAPMCYAP